MNEYDAKLYKIIGQKLREARKSHGYTLDYVGDKLDIIGKTVQRYEMGDRKISLNRIREMCTLYGIDYRVLINNAEKQISQIDGLADEGLEACVAPNAAEKENIFLAGELQKNNELKKLVYLLLDLREDELQALNLVVSRMKTANEE